MRLGEALGESAPSVPPSGRLLLQVPPRCSAVGSCSSDCPSFENMSEQTLPGSKFNVFSTCNSHSFCFSSGVSAKVWPSHKAPVMPRGVAPSRLLRAHVEKVVSEQSFSSAFPEGPPVGPTGGERPTHLLVLLCEGAEINHTVTHRLNFYKNAIGRYTTAPA